MQSKHALHLQVLIVVLAEEGNWPKLGMPQPYEPKGAPLELIGTALHYTKHSSGSPDATSFYGMAGPMGTIRKPITML